MDEQQRDRARVLSDRVCLSLWDTLLWEGTLTGGELAREVPDADAGLTLYLQRLLDAELVQVVAHGKSFRTNTWKALDVPFSWSSTSDDPNDAVLIQAVERSITDHEDERPRRFARERISGQWPDERWVDAAISRSYRLVVSVDRLDELDAALAEVAEQFKDPAAVVDDDHRQLALRITGVPRLPRRR